MRILCTQERINKVFNSPVNVATFRVAEWQIPNGGTGFFRFLLIFPAKTLSPIMYLKIEDLPFPLPVVFAGEI